MKDNEKQEKLIKPIYKWTKVLTLFCPKCKIRLNGNGSDIFPYYCVCGQWKFDIEKSAYKIVKF